MKTFKQFLNEEIFIGHKLKLQELQKTVKKNSDYLKYIAKALKENSNVGQYGQFCKDYPEYVSLYWYCGGRKLQPTKNECKALIEKVCEVKIDSLNADQKYNLFNHCTTWGY